MVHGTRNTIGNTYRKVKRMLTCTSNQSYSYFVTEALPERKTLLMDVAISRCTEASYTAHVCLFAKGMFKHNMHTIHAHTASQLTILVIYTTVSTGRWHSTVFFCATFFGCTTCLAENVQMQPDKVNTFLDDEPQPIRCCCNVLKRNRDAQSGKCFSKMMKFHLVFEVGNTCMGFKCNIVSLMFFVDARSKKVWNGLKFDTMFGRKSVLTWNNFGCSMFFFSDLVKCNLNQATRQWNISANLLTNAFTNEHWFHRLFLRSWFQWTNSLVWNFRHNPKHPETKKITWHEKTRPFFDRILFLYAYNMFHCITI